MRKYGSLLLLTVFLAARAQAPAAESSNPVEPDAFGAVIVLENGRKMPMDSFARIKLLQFSGKSTLHREPALNWLCRVFFEPEKAMTDKVFVISHPQVVQSMNLLPETRRRYSLEQLRPALPQLQQMARAAAGMDTTQRTVVEDELLRVAHNVNTYMSLAAAFRFALPNPSLSVKDDVLRKQLGIPDGVGALSVLDLTIRMPMLNDAALGDSEEAALREAMALSKAIGRETAMVRVNVPPMMPMQFQDDTEWVAPSLAMQTAVHDEQLRPMIMRLGDIVAAYRAGDQRAFDSAAAAYCAMMQAHIVPDRQTRHVDLEVRYNRMDLLYRSELLYGLAFLLGFASIVGGGRRLRIAALGCLLTGLALHSAAIALRMTIMGRPPVTNLYSTFLFVAWSTVLLCVIMEWVQKHGIGVLAGGLSGLALLLLSRRFVSMSDPMGVLVAVLDSNFWLATHVVTISLGYAGCCLAGVIGHIYLLQAIIRPANRERLRAVYVALFAMLGFGFTFSFLGTMLGGVWADQSWGRFWGWDPKENGALLIVLWCAILYHARASNMVRSIGMAAGSILGIIIVLFAWIGVNQLGVGLHTYGFTSGVALGLFAYTGIQLVILVVLVGLARYRTKGLREDAATRESQDEG